MSTLIGCETVRGASGEKLKRGDYISTLSVSCDNPYRLTEDCSKMMGAKRKIKMGDHKAKIAGTADGKIILVMDNSLFLNALQEGFTLGINNVHTESTQSAFEEIRKLFNSYSIKIEDVKVMGSKLSGTDGYFLILDKDGYSLLKDFSY